MGVLLCDLSPFTLDPGHTERVPDDVESLIIPDLREVEVAALARLRALRVLRVHRGTTAASLAALTAALPSVERLELWQTRTLGLEVIDALAGFPSLTEIFVDGLAVSTRAWFSRLAAMRPWRALGLAWNDEDTEELGLLASRPTLRALTLHLSGELSSERLAPLGSLSQLESLEVYPYGPRASRSLGDFAWLPRLTELRRLRFSVALDESVAALPSLEHLLAADVQRPSQLASLASLAHLTSLDLHGCSTWTLAHTAALSKLPALDTLVARPAPIDDRGLAKLLVARPWRKLDLDNFTAAGEAFANAPSTLTSLDLSFGDLTDEGLRAIARLDALRSLGIAYCSQVTAAGLTALASRTGLHALRLWGISSLDDGALSALVAHPSLRTLGLHNVPRVSNAVVAPWAERRGFAYTGPACHGELETLRADASAASEPRIEGLASDVAGTVVAARGRTSVALSPLGASTKAKTTHLRAAAWQLRFDARGELAVTTGAALVAWDVATAKKRATCKLPRGLAQCLDLTADGALAVVVVQRLHDALVLGWNPEAAAPAFSFATAHADEASVALSPDRASAVVSTVYVARYDVATQREWWRVADVTGAVTFTRDGAEVTVASRDEVVFLDAVTGRVLRRHAFGAIERAWWILYEHDALVRDRVARRADALRCRAVEARDDGVVIVAQVAESAAWVVVRVRGDVMRAARVEEADGSSLCAVLGLSRGGDHVWVHVTGERGTAPSVARVSRYRVDALFEA